VVLVVIGGSHELEVVELDGAGVLELVGTLEGGGQSGSASGVPQWV
jgi:hypothetical protein